MTAHPIDLVYVDGVNVAKSDVRGYAKARLPLRMESPSEVNSTSLTLQYGPVYVQSLGYWFQLDTTDTTTADDGVNCLIDSAGNRLIKIAVEAIVSERTVTAAGTITIGSDDDTILVNKTVPEITTVQLQRSSVRLAAGGERIKIVDLAGNASSFPITVKETFTFTVTIASPGVCTATAHGMVNGTPVIPTTTGALPTGLTSGTTYYVVNKATDTFQLAATVGGSAINTTGSQSGVHTAQVEFIAGGSQWVIGSDFDSVELHPRPDSKGYYK